MKRKLQNLLYAPIGLVSNASTVLPELADQGRQQVANARVMGKMAATFGRQRANLELERLGGAVQSFLVGAGLVEPSGTAPSSPSEPTGATEPEPAPEAEAERPVPDAPDAADLAIVEYDSLAASQVVPRLAALDTQELEDVRRYELAHRARKTILGRIAQLQG